MLCKTTKKCFHNGKLFNPGDTVDFKGPAKEKPEYFEPVKTGRKQNQSSETAQA